MTNHLLNQYLHIMFLCQILFTRPASSFTYFSHKSASFMKGSWKKQLRNFMQMSSPRGTAPGSKFESWYQRTVQVLDTDGGLSQIPLDESFSSNVGRIGKSNVTFRAKAWESKSLRYARLISFVGEGYDVFNFMAIPKAGLDIPILGIDVVSLPSKQWRKSCFAEMRNRGRLRFEMITWVISTHVPVYM